VCRWIDPAHRLRKSLEPSPGAGGGPQQRICYATSIGAGRARLVRQLLTESLVLAGAGAILGLGSAYAILSYLSHQGSIALPLLAMMRVDATVLEWTLLIAVAAALLFGAAPGFR
jgi:putative ABC transport system permease protein